MKVKGCQPQKCNDPKTGNDNNSEIILIGLESGKLLRLRWENGKIEELGSLNENLFHAGTVNQIRFKDMKTVATCGDDNQVKIFSLS